MTDGQKKLEDMLKNDGSHLNAHTAKVYCVKKTNNNCC